MPNFAYLARSQTGDEMSGVVTAASLDQVVDDLHGRGLVVLHVAEDALGGGRLASFRAKMNAPVLGGGVGTRDLALFTRQLSTLFEAGIPLVRGLRGLAADQPNRVLRRTLTEVGRTLESGTNLADAMAQHPRVFNRMYVSMIRAGEGAGTLDEILNELAIYLEKIDAIKTKVRSAMSYPVFVMIFAVGVTLFLLLKIIPTFEEIYVNLGAQLPALTQWLIDFSRLIRSNMFVSGGVTLAAIVLLWLWTRTPPGRYMKDWWYLKMPVFGPVINKAVISRMSRTFGILLRSGLPVLDAIELVKGATGNEVIARALDDIKAQVSRGSELTPAFRSTKRFPEMTLQMMDTGEESGQVDTMLLKVSDFYDRQVEASVQGITALIEPLLIVLVGIVVGVVVLSMFLPIFYLGDAIMKGNL